MKQKPLWLKWIFCAVPAFVAALMYFLLPHFPRFTEYAVARGLFRVIAFPYEWIMSALPFSVTEAVVILALPAIITLLTVWIIRIFRSKNRLITVERGCRFVAWCVSLALLIFMVMDGANFSRVPVGDLLELPDGTYTADDLYTVTCDLAKKASEARKALDEDGKGCAVLSVEQSELLLLADDCFDGLKGDYPFLKTAVWRVKSVRLSHWWSYTGTTGVYCPWLGEANANTDVPDYELGHTAVHEIAHTMGFAKENECNFLSWLACAQSGQPDYTYSGHLQAYIYCANALYRADKELWQKARALCSEAVLRDMRQSNAYWQSFEGEVRETSQKLNDTFIKVNGVESGVLSYNEMVGLMLRYYDKCGLLG
ncbi:MAG: DUF3810 domain-containing protein [Clostridia bacterium]|nr:DUF3810 domain-containing protein [Clostridia bacterium]